MDPITEPLHVLVFEIADHTYALPIETALEVVPAAATTPLPRTPGLVEGVIDLRGRIVPVLDLRARFGLPPKPIEPADHMIVARAAARVCVLRVDRATGVTVLDPESIVSPEEVARGLDLLAGIAKTSDGLILIHDLATFFSAAEAEALDARRVGPARGGTAAEARWEASVGYALRAGSRRVNVLPSPGTLSTSTSPPISRAR